MKISRQIGCKFYLSNCKLLHQLENDSRNWRPHSKKNRASARSNSHTFVQNTMKNTYVTYQNFFFRLRRESIFIMRLILYDHGQFGKSREILEICILHPIWDVIISIFFKNTLPNSSILQPKM